MADRHDRIAPLSDLSDYEVADHDPDVRGWDVIAADGRKIGEVEDLVVDTQAMKVRYLDVEVDKDFRADDDNRRILIPVGQAQLHDDEDHVHVKTLSSADVRAYPAHGGRFDRTYEDSIHTRFGTASAGAAGAASARGGDFYAGSNFDDARFYGSRRGTAAGRDAGTRDRGDRMTLSEEELQVGRAKHEAGEVRVGKHVETEHVSRDVPVTRETATVERRPLSEEDARHAQARISEDEIRVPLVEEEVIVEKRAVPKEELVVKKHQVQDTEHVEADLRRERADIDRTDDPNRKHKDRR